MKNERIEGKTNEINRKFEVISTAKNEMLPRMKSNCTVRNEEREGIREVKWKEDCESAIKGRKRIMKHGAVVGQSS